MLLHLAWYGSAERDIERATLQDEVELVRRKHNDVERGNRVIESWVLRAGGEMLVEQGTRGQAGVPAEHLDELPDIVQQYEEATESTLAVGVGSEPAEAAVALRVAEARGGSPAIILYTPDIAQEAHDLRDHEEGEDDEDGFTSDESDALESAGAPVAKNQFGDQPSPGEATKVAQGDLSPMHAAPSAPSPVSPASPPAQDPNQQGGGATPAAGPQQASPDQLRQAVAQVLQDVKQQLPNIENMKQTAPDAYQAILGMVEAMLALAKQRFGGEGAVQSPVAPQQQGEPTQKSEGQIPQNLQAFRTWTGSRFAPISEDVESPGYPRPSECFERGGGHKWRAEVMSLGRGVVQTRYFCEGCSAEGRPEPTQKAEHPGVTHPYHPLKPTPSGRHEHVAPVGTSIEGQGRVKVVHPDGSESWVEVRDGQVMASDSHTISSLRQDCGRGVPTPPPADAPVSQQG